jgi:hypothetical protein
VAALRPSNIALPGMLVGDDLLMKEIQNMAGLFVLLWRINVLRCFMACIHHLLNLLMTQTSFQMQSLIPMFHLQLCLQENQKSDVAHLYHQAPQFLNRCNIFSLNTCTNVLTH